MFADQHIEHDAVDLVVDAVVGDDAHLLFGLAVAVHAAFALLVARRVPGEIVVDDGVEVLLQVDAFAEAVGADQHPLVGDWASCAMRSSRSAGGSSPVTAIDLHALWQTLAQGSGHVFGGRDEAAEDDGWKPSLSKASTSLIARCSFASFAL